MMAVNTAPKRTPKRGLEKAVRRLVKAGISATGFTAPLISSMPYIKMAKPISTRPTSRRRCFLEAIMSMMPIKASRGEKLAGLRSLTNTLSLSMPARDKIQAVAVVPMLEPMITPMVWLSCMTPELTRPTSMTVTAEEDWMMAVNTAPRRRLFRGLEVMRLSRCSSLPPAIFSRLLDMRSIP